MLDTVIKQNFSDITAGIFSKTMQDVFVLLGGVGAVLCLVIAILLFAKKKGVRNLAYMAAPSLVFNISEIVLFGVPVILNPILLIPFMLVPMVNYLVTYAAMFFGNGKNSSGYPSQYWLLNPSKGGKMKSVITNSLSAGSPWSTEYGITPTNSANGISGPTTDSNWAMYTTVITEDSITGYYLSLIHISEPTRH